jgi:hypothetical protein
VSSLLGWASIAPVLLSLCSIQSNDEQIDTFEHADSNVYVSPETQARIVLRVTSSRELGTDRRWADDGTETNISWTVVRVQILCESDQDVPEQNAQAYLENVRLRLRRSRSLEQLDAVQASLLTVGEIVASSGVDEEGRSVDAKAFDLELSCVLVDTDPETVGSWIETIGLAGQISGGVTPLAFGADPVTEVEIA